MGVFECHIHQIFSLKKAFGWQKHKLQSTPVTGVTGYIFGKIRALEAMSQQYCLQTQSVDDLIIFKWKSNSHLGVAVAVR